jgi:MoxR-like ATPase
MDDTINMIVADSKEFRLKKEALQNFRTVKLHIEREFNKIVLGQQELLDLLLRAVFSGGHVLLEGIPGLAKTLSFDTLARLLGCRWDWLQLNVDVRPRDIIGYFDDRHEPPIFVQGFLNSETNFYVLDEVNRTSEATQGAFLRGMQEGHVKVRGHIEWLPPVRLFGATQNPFDARGNPLEAAQVDRFLFKIIVRNPDRSAMLEIAERASLIESDQDLIGKMESILDTAAILEWRRLIEEWRDLVRDDIRRRLGEYRIENYVSRIVSWFEQEVERQRREGKSVLEHPISARIIKPLVNVAWVTACMEPDERDPFIPYARHVRKNLIPALRHRIRLFPGVRDKEKEIERLIKHCVFELAQEFRYWEPDKDEEDIWSLER